MRKVTQQTCIAFMNREKRKIGNTESDGTSLFLHGNEIAKHTIDGLMITNAGWRSNTTKERLNGLPNVHIFQKKGEWFLNGKAWNGEWVLIEGNRHN